MKRGKLAIARNEYRFDAVSLVERGDVLLVLLELGLARVYERHRFHDDLDVVLELRHESQELQELVPRRVYRRKESLVLVLQVEQDRLAPRIRIEGNY